MKKILLLAAIIIPLISCEKLLEENPKSIASETFYNTAAEVESAVNAIYYPVGVS